MSISLEITTPIKFATGRLGAILSERRCPAVGGRTEPGGTAESIAGELARPAFRPGGHEGGAATPGHDCRESIPDAPGCRGRIPHQHRRQHRGQPWRGDNAPPRRPLPMRCREPGATAPTQLERRPLGFTFAQHQLSVRRRIIHYQNPIKTPLR